MCILLKCECVLYPAKSVLRNKMRIKKGPGMAAQAEDAPTGLCVI